MCSDLGLPTLVPLFTYTDNLYKNQTHAYYILVTKQDVHYRISILNRGWGSENHRYNEQNQSNGDVSYDNVPFKKIKKYLAGLIELKEFQIAEEAYKALLGETLQGIGPFKLMLYGLPALCRCEGGSTAITEFRSNHLRSRQKIGNCGIASLMSAISFHVSMQTGEMRNKTLYKKFIYSYKKMIFENYSYLLDFDLEAKKRSGFPSLSAERQLDKMKRKLHDNVFSF